MQLQQASRRQAKIRCALQGASGAGKTMSALLIAYGLCGDWQKIAVIDTENRSADLYAHLGPYQVLSLHSPFTPERYIQALKACKDAGMEVIIVDSVSHEWEGLGGILETHSRMQGGNSFSNWAKLTPRHNAFIQTMLQMDVHILATIRAKQDYVLVQRDGKQVPEKVGLKGITKDGLDYEFTIVLDVDTSLHAKVSKDRTSLFHGKPAFIPSVDTGRQILAWCNEGVEAIPRMTSMEMQESIHACDTVDHLLQLYKLYPEFQESLLAEFTNRRQQLNQLGFQAMAAVTTMGGLIPSA